MSVKIATSKELSRLQRRFRQRKEELNNWLPNRLSVANQVEPAEIRSVFHSGVALYIDDSPVPATAAPPVPAVSESALATLPIGVLQQETADTVLIHTNKVCKLCCGGFSAAPSLGLYPLSSNRWFFGFSNDSVQIRQSCACSCVHAGSYVSVACWCEPAICVCPCAQNVCLSCLSGRHWLHCVARSVLLTVPKIVDNGQAANTSWSTMKPVHVTKWGFA